jgi:hypothetical protein
MTRDRGPRTPQGPPRDPETAPDLRSFRADAGTRPPNRPITRSTKAVSPGASRCGEIRKTAGQGPYSLSTVIELVSTNSGPFGAVRERRVRDRRPWPADHPAVAAVTVRNRAGARGTRRRSWQSRSFGRTEPLQPQSRVKSPFVAVSAARGTVPVSAVSAGQRRFAVPDGVGPCRTVPGTPVPSRSHDLGLSGLGQPRRSVPRARAPRGVGAAAGRRGGARRC